MNTPDYSLNVQIERILTIYQLTLHHTEIKDIKPVIFAHIGCFPVCKMRIWNSKQPFLNEKYIWDIKNSIIITIIFNLFCFGYRIFNNITHIVIINVGIHISLIVRWCAIKKYLKTMTNRQVMVIVRNSQTAVPLFVAQNFYYHYLAISYQYSVPIFVEKQLFLLHFVVKNAII